MSLAISASLVIPIEDPTNGFFYPTVTFRIYSYILIIHVTILSLQVNGEEQNPPYLHTLFRVDVICYGLAIDVLSCPVINVQFVKSRNVFVTMSKVHAEHFTGLCGDCKFFLFLDVTRGVQI